jgi:hypothetical protein
MKKYEISVIDGKKYIRIRVNEPVTPDLLEGFLRETAEKANESGVNNLLFDLRRAPNRTSSVWHYNFVHKRFKQLGFKRRNKHALVVGPEDKDYYYFVETLLINAGYQGKMFTDKSTAIEWLEK